MPEKNSIVELTVTAMSSEGSGVARLPDGMAVFIPGTAVGDTVLCRLVKMKNAWRTVGWKRC